MGDAAFIVQVPAPMSVMGGNTETYRTEFVQGFGRRPRCSPLYLDRPSSETLNKSGGWSAAALDL
jgi:hypothetical protein